MRHYLRGILVLALACALLPYARALAAPERLGDLVPDAVPDGEGLWNFAWGHEAISLDGPLNDEQTARDYFKLRYTFSPKVSATLRYTSHDLVNGYGLITPVLNNVDSSGSYTANLDMNLMTTPRVDADKAKNVAFAAGSAFGIGVTGTQYLLKADNLDQNETLIAAYLIYSTDLTEEMRAHTYFSSGRLSGDAYTGSVNRVGAGLDYTLMPGKRPLELMVDGVLDIYNFRQPSFNTSRVSRFDFGLRYRIAQDWYATIGWATVNDSESNNSGSGMFGGINYCQGPKAKKEKKECPPPPPPAAPAGTPPPAQPSAAAPETQTQLAMADQPPLMASAQASAPAAADPAATPAPAEPAATPAPAEPAAVPAPADPVDAGGSAAQPADKTVASAAPEPAPAAPGAADDAAAAPLDPAQNDGIAIPEPPVETPLPTPEGAVMLRAGIDPPPADNAPAKEVASAAEPAPAEAKPAEDVAGETPAAEAAGSETSGVMEIAALSPVTKDDAAPEAAGADGQNAAKPQRSKVPPGSKARRNPSRLKRDE